MSRPGLPVPPLLLALDVLGAVLIVLGVLALTGIDFGYPVLVTLAPGLIATGIGLMVPIVVWAVRRKAAAIPRNGG